ncbi:MAG TPA: hypothetical protein VL832_01630 [Puia sp.]|nr:hypothetical protein [Puia sp.]
MKRTILLASLFLFLHLCARSQSVDYGKSYVNITKGPGGGTNEPGDILEIRATFVVKSGTAYQCSYSDMIPTGTYYIPSTLRVLTNEGKIFRQWTDITGDDGGYLTGNNVTINIGTGANATTGGTITSGDKPKFGSTCIMVASFRVQISPSLSFGDNLDVGGGSFTYYDHPHSGSHTVNFSPDTIIIYKNYGICSNTVGGNALVSEFGGTFGTGVTKDRSASTKVPSNYTYTTFTTANPNDYYYGVSNNTSPGNPYFTTVNTWPIPDNHRVFQTWDVIGDHTNAADPYLGNPPGPFNTFAGYMVVINAAYRTDTAFKDVVTNLCPNTYYQYTAWFRNIGPKGGTDSNGVSAISGNSSYIPTGPGDSSGVHPNLTFNANGYDYYTTGDIAYTGLWVQKGFTFKTGPNQNQMTIYIRNNAPGGGGNDWAIDDISVASCSPSLTLTPAKPDTLCQATIDTVGFKVSSYFDSYSFWQIEQSTDGGSTWTSAGNDFDGAASSGSSTPVFNSGTGQYEYSVTRHYFLSLGITHILYRIRVAGLSTSLSNSSCSYASTTSKSVQIIDCNIVLPFGITSFTGKLQDGLASLQWIGSNETAGMKYIIERSDDQTHYTPVGALEGQAVAGGDATYHFTDPKAVQGPTYYRVRAVSGDVGKYSTVVLLSSAALDFRINSLVNPFIDNITFDLVSPGNQRASFILVDAYGRVVKRQDQYVTKGLNNIVVPDLSGLTSGMYALQVQCGGQMVCKPVIKTSAR